MMDEESSSLAYFIVSNEEANFDEGVEELVAGGEAGGEAGVHGATGSAVQQELTAGISQQVQANTNDNSATVSLEGRLPATLKREHYLGAKNPSTDSESSDFSSVDGDVNGDPERGISSSPSTLLQGSPVKSS